MTQTCHPVRTQGTSWNRTKLYSEKTVSQESQSQGVEPCIRAYEAWLVTRPPAKQETTEGSYAQAAAQTRESLP